MLNGNLAANQDVKFSCKNGNTVTKSNCTKNSTIVAIPDRNNKFIVCRKQKTADRPRTLKKKEIGKSLLFK